MEEDLEMETDTTGTEAVDEATENRFFSIFYYWLMSLVFMKQNCLILILQN